MSSGTTTRGQAVARYERLRRRVENVKLPDGLQKDLVDAAKAVLDMFPITSAASSSAGVPEPDEVEELLKTLLPSPVDVFTDRFFRTQLFALVTLYNVAEFYGCVIPQDPIYDLLGFTEQDKNNKNVAVHIWFADFLGCDRENILSSVNRYKATRATPDLIRRLPRSPSRHDPRTEQELPSGNAPEGQRENNGRAESGAGFVNRDHEAPRADGPRVETRTPPTEPSGLVENDANDSRKATNVLQYLKDNKFNGDLSQSIDMTLRDDNVCARQHRLNARQKADFFINVLDGPARTFFFNNARDDMDFEGMARMMERHCPSQYNRR